MARRKGVPACQRGFFIFVSSRPGRTEGAASRTQMVLLLLVALPRRSGRTLPRLPAAHVAPGAARQGPANHRRLLLHRERVLLVGSPRGRDGRHVAVVRNRPSGGPSSGRVLSPSAAAPGCVAVVHASPRHGSVCDDGPRAGPLRRSQPVPVRARSHRGGGDLIEGLGSVVIFGAWTGHVGSPMCARPVGKPAVLPRLEVVRKVLFNLVDSRGHLHARVKRCRAFCDGTLRGEIKCTSFGAAPIVVSDRFSGDRFLSRRSHR
mmetsp:Transcript_85711/g.171577  ORF Transcript_85711/g.171577 Transcript_85711/m.171577 type:complete len:262 (-) Transcript_85711:185-970(-)